MFKRCERDKASAVKHLFYIKKKNQTKAYCSLKIMKDSSREVRFQIWYYFSLSFILKTSNML